MFLTAVTVIMFEFFLGILLFTLDTIGVTIVGDSLKCIKHDFTLVAVTSPRNIFTELSFYFVSAFNPLNVASKLSIHIITIDD